MDRSTSAFISAADPTLEPKNRSSRRFCRVASRLSFVASLLRRERNNDAPELHSDIDAAPERRRGGRTRATDGFLLGSGRLLVRHRPRRRSGAPVSFPARVRIRVARAAVVAAESRLRRQAKLGCATSRRRLRRAPTIGANRRRRRRGRRARFLHPLALAPAADIHGSVGDTWTFSKPSRVRCADPPPPVSSPPPFTAGGSTEGKRANGCGGGSGGGALNLEPNAAACAEGPRTLPR